MRKLAQELAVQAASLYSHYRTKEELLSEVAEEVNADWPFIVDADADLDEAVQGIVQSSFGYAGQKCSACSRALVVDGVAPYLDLPGTGLDTYGRTARGYSEGQFRGERLAYGEVEYRAPLTRNGLLGMVAFLNTTTVTNFATDERLFDSFATGAGAGLRLRPDPGVRRGRELRRLRPVPPRPANRVRSLSRISRGFFGRSCAAPRGACCNDSPSSLISSPLERPPMSATLSPRSHANGNGTVRRQRDAAPSVEVPISMSRYLTWKGILDRAFAAALLIPGLPMIAILVALVRLTSRGPGIFRQVRVGRGGTTFTMYKLRSMRIDAEVRSGPTWASPGRARRSSCRSRPPGRPARGRAS